MTAKALKKPDEVAAGGIVEKDGKLLLVKVTNLKGEVKWTFPKGHLEKGEEPLDAALREVEEETGWKCEETAELEPTEYWFQRQGRDTFKRVHWYRMKPVEKTGKPDAHEIMETKWASPAESRELLSYPNDLKMLERLK